MYYRVLDLWTMQRLAEDSTSLQVQESLVVYTPYFDIQMFAYRDLRRKLV